MLRIYGSLIAPSSYIMRTTFQIPTIQFSGQKSKVSLCLRLSFPEKKVGRILLGDGTRCDLHIKFPDICYLTFKNLIYHSDYFSGLQIHDHSGCLQLEDEESHFDP